MLAVVRSERAAPANAGGVSYDAAGAALRLLTAENRELFPKSQKQLILRRRGEG